MAVVNWRIVYLGKQGKKTPSIVPLIGGLILALGISRFPFGVVQRFWPVGLIADYGCLPYLVLFFKFLLDERISQMVERD